MSNWASDLEPLFEKYGKRKHPLEYQNRYQLLAMVLMAAQDSDSKINRMAPEFFSAFPSLEALKDHSPEDLYPLTKSVRGFRKKSDWLVRIAKILGEDSRIPLTIAELSKLPGIGRKSANVIIRESGAKAEGIMVDLHVVRVAPRLGVADGKPDKIEKELMEAMPPEKWNDTGMVLSYHGREICRPKPLCSQCIVRQVCNYYQNVVRKEPTLMA